MFYEPERPRANTVPDYLIFTTPTAIFSFLLAGVSQEILWAIQHLRIQFEDLVFDPANEVHESYLAGIRILLRILPNLQDLVLLWENISPRVFDGVDFRLAALTSTMSMNEFEGLKFLSMQDGLTLLELPYWQAYNSSNSSRDRSMRGDRGSNPTPQRPFLPPEALLPGLSEVSLPPAGVMQLVPGRPVRSVDIRLVGRRRTSSNSLTSFFPGGLQFSPRMPITPSSTPSSFGGSRPPVALALKPLRIGFDVGRDESEADSDSEHEGSDSDEWDWDPRAISHLHTPPHRPYALNEEHHDSNDRLQEEEDEEEEDEPVTQLETHEWPALMHALRESAAVVDDLAIATLDQFDPDVILRAVAAHLPYLRALYIRVYTPVDTTQVSTPLYDCFFVSAYHHASHLY